MKKDLDYIFKKIRAIKTKLSAQYPDAFAEAVRSSLAEECEEDEDLNESSASNKKDNRRSLHLKNTDTQNVEMERRASQ
jgi:hypothetical protein